MAKVHAGIGSLLGIIGLAFGLGGCGGSGKGTAESGDGPRHTLTGTVRSISGNQSEMAGWILVLVERDTGISRVDEIGPLGTYELPGVRVGVAHTLVLLDPSYRFSAILTYPGNLPGTVFQYFTLEGSTLPTVVHSGPIINFNDTSHIRWEANVAADSNSDLIPDGLSLVATVPDTDGDGWNNHVDPDISGNGVPNWFDSDTDGDGIPDIFDPDSNGDGVLDIASNVGDIHFNNGLAYALVQVNQNAQSDGSLATTLLMTTKTHSDYKGLDISMRGPDALFDGAKAQSVRKDNGTIVSNAWDGLLLDDGLSEDGAPGDGIYARKVELASGLAPRSNQVVFFKVRRDLGGGSYFYDEYPYTFPDVITGVVTGAYIDSGRIEKSGQPFGEIETYLWSVHIFDGAGLKVFSSPPLSGEQGSYNIPAGILDANQSYRAEIVANSLPRIPSYPAWIVRSESFQLQ